MAPKRKIKAGEAEFEFPSQELQELRDSSADLECFDVLKARLQAEGYLFIRGFHPTERINAAREQVLDYMVEVENVEDRTILSKDAPKLEGILDSRCGRGCVPFIEKFFDGMFEEKSITLDFKWLRAMYHEGFTGIHVDNVYMSRGSPEMLTIWTPFQDTSIIMGTILINERSHCLPGFSKFQETYGNVDIEAVQLQGTGWYGQDPKEVLHKFGGQWRTADFNVGDVVIFTMRTVHMSSTNITQKARISCDTRWQPASHKLDERFFGAELPKKTAPKFGNWSESDTTNDDATTMEKLRQQWGI